MIKAILFDIDDTLFPSKKFAEKARRNAIDAMVSMGLPVSSSSAYARLQKIIRRKGSNYPKHFDDLLRELHVRDRAKFIAAGVAAYHNTKASILPFPQVPRALARLREQGRDLYIASQGRAVKQWDKLIRLGLHHFFQGVFVSEDLKCEKGRRFYSTILKKLRLAPEEVLMVGDRFDLDIAPARAVGIHTVHVTGGRRVKKGAGRRVKTIGGLFKVMREIEGA